jgi:hypothetical protein
MKRARSLFAVLLAIPLWAQSPGPKDSQRLDEAPIFTVYNDGSIGAEGMLRPDNLTEQNELAFDTVTRYECYKHACRQRPA